MSEQTKGFQRLGYLAAALRQGSIRAGADSLDIAPSVVSRQISILENEVGFKLIEGKGRNGVVGTEAAQILLECFEQQQASSQHAIAKLDNLRTHSDASVRIVASGGFLPSVRKHIAALLDVQSHSPVTIEFMPASKIVNELLEGHFHFGLVVAPIPHPDIEVLAHIKQPLKLIVSADHELIKSKGSIDFSMINRYPLALSSPTIGVRQLIRRVETYEKVSLQPELTTNSLGLLHAYVLCGRGVTLSPELAFSDYLATGKAVALPVVNATFLSTEACLVARHGQHLPKAALECIEFCKSLPLFNEESQGD